MFSIFFISITHTSNCVSKECMCGEQKQSVTDWQKEKRTDKLTYMLPQRYNKHVCAFLVKLFCFLSVHMNAYIIFNLIDFVRTRSHKKTAGVGGIRVVYRWNVGYVARTAERGQKNINTTTYIIYGGYHILLSFVFFRFVLICICVHKIEQLEHFLLEKWCFLSKIEYCNIYLNCVGLIIVPAYSKCNGQICLLI